ncbi:hypothetical protein C8J56DRAFT_1059258 [Mycena floridula]|nr:hypothetical protein C8J56DRAFT_1059258 [Mycena floridula]
MNQTPKASSDASMQTASHIGHRQEGSSDSASQNPQIQLLQQISDLQASIFDHNNQIAINSANLLEVQSQVNTLTGEVAQMEMEIALNSAHLVEVRSQVNKLGSEITEIKTLLKQLLAKVIVGKGKEKE